MEHTTKGQKSPTGFLCPDCNNVMPLGQLSGNTPEAWASELQTNEALSSILKAFENSGEEIAMKCAFHAEKEVEFYCEDHEMLLCSLCATLTHKPCTDVVTIPVAAARRKADGGKFINFLSEQITMTEKILSDRKEQLITLDKSETEIKNQLTQIKKRMIDYLDSMESKIIQEMTQRKMKEMHALKSDLDICNGILVDATSSLKPYNNRLIRIHQLASSFDLKIKYKCLTKGKQG
ncbi:TRIM2_3 [Mytilus coruscus]|uniref:TRIM2_3 n=1 Tax=Mytilus coruscus TaxID=42192 RepID=A0A6J8C402_MYTCO|nr:TRIM2_3 [Mytilus coruscus]